MAKFTTYYSNNPGQSKEMSKENWTMYTIDIKDNKTTQELRERWIDLNQLNGLYLKILEMIKNRKDLPYQEIPKIELSNAEKSYTEFLDLRGINLSNLDLSDMDLSFCIFDYADLENTICNKTHFQNSSLNKTNLDGSIWASVQASPISMTKASFKNGEIKQSYIMEANCSETNFTNTKMMDTDFAHCFLKNTRFTNEKISFSKEVYSTIFKNASKESVFIE